MSALEDLTRMELANKHRRYPNLPTRYFVKPKFSVKDYNSLMKAVKRCLELHGCYVTCIQSQGQWNPTLKQFTRSTTKRGTADLHAIINGQHVSIEIKWEKNQMSVDQKKTAQQVQAAGGVYLVVKDYNTFWAWFEQLAPNLVQQKGGER